METIQTSDGQEVQWGSGGWPWSEHVRTQRFQKHSLPSRSLRVRGASICEGSVVAEERALMQLRDISLKSM